jgi:hypothetical protein
MGYILRFTGQDGRARIIPGIGFGGEFGDILPPTLGKCIGHIEF